MLYANLKMLAIFLLVDLCVVSFRIIVGEELFQCTWTTFPRRAFNLLVLEYTSYLFSNLKWLGHRRQYVWTYYKRCCLQFTHFSSLSLTSQVQHHHPWRSQYLFILHHSLSTTQPSSSDTQRGTVLQHEGMPHLPTLLSLHMKINLHITVCRS